MNTGCLELLSLTEIYHTLGSDDIVQLSMADYSTDLPLLYACFPLNVGSSGRLYISFNQ